jgi:outer membrane receptor protein involved in Fe transport
VTGNDAADLDVTAPVGSTQFALTGLSDTANITGIYEKYGISARVSWNWRDSFLASPNRGGGFDTPIFVQSFSQVDASISYDVTENITVTLEGINLTGEDFVTFGRSRSQVLFAQELAPRFLFGARYRF